jgi:X-Pro dipeptidyl-peptidase (S15 family)
MSVTSTARHTARIAITFAGTQDWSNGRAGLSGVSYLTSSQWTIAATRPPHLAAINPWEGWSDDLPGVGQARRHPGDLLLAVHRGLTASIGFPVPEQPLCSHERFNW